MNKKLLFCLALSLLLTFALSLALAGCSEELPTEVSAESSSSDAESQTSSEADSSTTEDSSAPADSSAEEEPSVDEDSSEAAFSDAPSSEPEESSDSPSEPEESSEDPSSEPEESSDTPSEPEESSEEPSSEPEESSDLPSEPEASSEEPSSEPEESSDIPSEPEESSEEPEESSEEAPSEPDGSGTEEDPYLYIPKEDEPVRTVEIAGGAFYHFAIYRVGGMDLVIESDDVYVIYEGVTYTPKNGVLSLRIERELASTAILFVIGNNGSEAQSFSLSFSSPLGSMSNPEKITDFADDRFVSLEANDEMGYFYRYVATQSGTIRFYFTATQSSMIVATNNRSFAQRSSGDSDAVDEQGRQYFDIEVEVGDELVINMGAIPNRRGKYPATDITWCAEYLA